MSSMTQLQRLRELFEHELSFTVQVCWLIWNDELYKKAKLDGWILKALRYCDEVKKKKNALNKKTFHHQSTALNLWSRQMVCTFMRNAFIIKWEERLMAAKPKFVLRRNHLAFVQVCAHGNCDSSRSARLARINSHARIYIAWRTKQFSDSSSWWWTSFPSKLFLYQEGTEENRCYRFFFAREGCKRASSKKFSSS